MELRTRLLTLVLMLASVPVQAQTVQGMYATSPNGNDSTYLAGFTTARRNGGALSFLFFTGSDVIEVAKPAAFGPANAVLNRWTLPASVASEKHSLSYDAAKEILWVTSGDGYTVVTNPGRVTGFTLGANGAVTQVKVFTISNVVAKRAWGSVQAVPASLQAAYGGAYAIIGGGYTSLLAQGGAASLGPAVYAIPDPDTIPNGASITARVVLDAAASRGARLSIPQNYFDGGDVRQNPSTRPTVPPASSGGFLSPRPDGLGWMVWGDSTYSSGFFVGTTLSEVWSLCGGACWYQTSTLAFDRRVYELHQWTAAPTSVLQKPDTMTALTLPQGAGMASTPIRWQGDTSAGNVLGASYDAASGLLYVAGCPFGDSEFECRVYALSLTGGPAPTPAPVPTPTPTPTPTPAPTPQGLPAGAVRLAGESESFTLTSPQTVYYGATAGYVSKALAAGTYQCSHGYGGSQTTFSSDPAPGTGKDCYAVPAVVTPPTPTPTPTPVPVPPPTPVDPCVAVPLTVTSITWPTAGTGSKQLRYSSPQTIEAVNLKARTFTDSRGCTVTK